jgi:phosphoenolpyruvate carboxykinase (ATP)
VWLLNTGYTGGPYGIGKRMSLPHTRALITAALTGKLDSVAYNAHPVFGVSIPTACDGVPAEVLNPRTTWSNAAEYDAKANELAVEFNKNFAKYADVASDEIKAAAPKAMQSA